MKSKKRTFTAITIIIIILSLFHYIGWLTPIENFLRDIIMPGSKIMYKWSIHTNEGETKTFESFEDLKNAYTELNEKLLASKIDEIKMQLLEQENEELRSQLNFFKNKELIHIGAEVIGSNIDPAGSTLIIDKGLRDGIKEGYAVIVNDGVMIGKIFKVHEKNSIVRLINDNQSKVAASILNREKSIGLVEGGFGISVRMNFIPQNEDIEIGEMVITSGLEEKIPRGLILGEIEAIEKEPYQPFQRAFLSIPKKLDRISIVSVITEIE